MVSVLHHIMRLASATEYLVTSLYTGCTDARMHGCTDARMHGCTLLYNCGNCDRHCGKTTALELAVAHLRGLFA